LLAAIAGKPYDAGCLHDLDHQFLDSNYSRM